MFSFFHKNRRRQKRETCLVRSFMVFPSGVRVAGAVVDLSRSGCRFRPNHPGVFASSEGAVLLLPNARIPCAIRKRRGGNFHCQFSHDLHQATVSAWVGAETDELSKRLAQSRMRYGE